MMANRRSNMSLQPNLMVLFMLGGLLAACSKGLPPSVMPAVMKADSKNVQASLRKGANVNEKDSRGMTALMIASERGDTEIVQALLDKGADVYDKEARLGRTALLLGVAKGHAAGVLALLKKGADAKDKDNGGLNPALLFGRPSGKGVVAAPVGSGGEGKEREGQAAS